VVAALVVIVCNALPWLAALRLKESQDAVARGDAAAAVGDAFAARNLEPWAASPYLQLALIAEQTGAPDDARQWLASALARSPRDWRLWLVAARLDTKRGAAGAAQRELRRAKQLNPRSPLFANTG